MLRSTCRLESVILRRLPLRHKAVASRICEETHLILFFAPDFTVCSGVQLRLQCTPPWTLLNSFPQIPPLAGSPRPELGGLVNITRKKKKVKRNVNAPLNRRIRISRSCPPKTGTESLGLTRPVCASGCFHSDHEASRMQHTKLQFTAPLSPALESSGRNYLPQHRGAVQSPLPQLEITGIDVSPVERSHHAR